jgi:hypothetical protein
MMGHTKRFGKLYAKAILIDYISSLIWGKVLLGSTSRIISLGKYLVTCSSGPIVN